MVESYRYSHSQPKDRFGSKVRFGAESFPRPGSGVKRSKSSESGHLTSVLPVWGHCRRGFRFVRVESNDEVDLALYQLLLQTGE